MKSYPSPPYNAARIARVAGQAARVAYDTYQNYQSIRQEPTANVGVTNQHDNQVIYQRKRMPLKKRKQWTDFSKKVNAVVNKSLGTKTMLINNIDALSAAVGDQIFASYTLYGANGSDGSGYRGPSDMSIVAQNVTLARKLIYKSGILDLTITNTLATAPIELDIYHVTYNNENFANSPNAVFSNASNSSITPVTTGTTIVLPETRGASPFDFPLALSAARISILKKTKVFLGPSNCTTYQIRDLRDHHVLKYDFANETTGNNFVKPGMTQGVILIAKTIAGFSATAPGMYVGATRKYSYLTIQDNQAETGRE